MKKCNECHSVNNSNAKYCRCCGVVLENILKLYPKMRLVPTNFYDWRKPKIGIIIKFILYIAITICIAFSIFSIFSYYNYYQTSSQWLAGEEYKFTEFTVRTSNVVDIVYFGYGYTYKIKGNWYPDVDVSDDGQIFGVGERCSKRNSEIESLNDYRKQIEGAIFRFCLIGIVLFMIKYFICTYPNRPKGLKTLNNYADYVQKYSYWGIFRKRKTPKFILFIKDNKFGILDVAHYKVYLPAQYDYLEWREKKKYLNATLNDRKFIIDINGNELK